MQRIMVVSLLLVNLNIFCPPKQDIRKQERSDRLYETRYGHSPYMSQKRLTLHELEIIERLGLGALSDSEWEIVRCFEGSLKV
ncbi:hypothetical protein KAZ82_01145 [Candidatus Babeliales bacterium]|nr:hypothetical protein [Candidatus Babeliales bacterium]